MSNRPNMPKPSVLFILKKRHAYRGYSHERSSGLYNSALFASEMLASLGYRTDLVLVTDNNDIDREVTKFNPDVVIIEALWVVPHKFDVLQMLHPTVNWIVRIHSEAPFLSQEGVAIDWISQYALNFSNVYVAANSREAQTEIGGFFPEKGIGLNKLLYLPTFYPAPRHTIYNKKFKGHTINVASMGALRTLKDTLIQAMAAMKFCDINEYKLRFHVNACIWDIEGSPIYKNLVSLFEFTNHELISHDWMTHDEFMQFLGTIDLGMQVSFSETFCIVAADFVAAGVPLVGSPTIRWIDPRSQADPITELDIVNKMTVAMQPKFLTRDLKKINLNNLQTNAEDAQEAWVETLNNFPAGF